MKALTLTCKWWPIWRRRATARGLELRTGSQLCQKGIPELLRRVLERARQLTAAPLLLRLERGNDTIETIAAVEAHNEQDQQGAPAHYVIKWNPRQESAEQLLAYAEKHGDWSEQK